DGNGSHASTLKSPSYTKSVSWQHYHNDSAYTAIDAEGKAEMKFIACYVATNATVTAGTANADSQFTVEYKK
ncbi:fimbrial protein, partial [Shigella flexneri]|nr:fimbrial protein [Shigella flexneri]